MKNHAPKLLLIVAALLTAIVFGWLPSLLENRAEAAETTGDGIAWRTDYKAALAEAKKDGKLVVADFFATWCGPCKVMDRTTFADARVQKRMRDFIPLKIDVDRQHDVAQLYGIQGMPTTAVLLASGEPITGAAGYLDAATYLDLLDAATDPEAIARARRLPRSASKASSRLRSAWILGLTCPPVKKQSMFPNIAAKWFICSPFNPGVRDAIRMVFPPWSMS